MLYILYILYITDIIYYITYYIMYYIPVDLNLVQLQ